MAYTNKQLKIALKYIKDSIEGSIYLSTNSKNNLLFNIKTYITDYENSLYRSLKRDRIVNKICYYERTLRKMIYLDNVIEENGTFSREQILNLANHWEQTN